MSPPLLAFPTYLNQTPSPALPAIVHAIEVPGRAGAFPKATKISIFRWIDFGEMFAADLSRPGLQDDPFKSCEVLEHDLINNPSIRLPYLGLPKFPRYDMMRYPVGEKSKTDFGNKRALATLAEGRAWDTTLSASRLPDSSANSDETREREHVCEDSVMDLFDQGEELKTNTMDFCDKKTGEMRKDFEEETEMAKQVLAVQVVNRDTREQ